MRTSRLVAGLVTVGLVGLAPIAISAPANAAAYTSVATLAVSAPPTSGAYEVGDLVSFTGSVKSSTTTNTPDNGTVSLQISTPSVPAWTTVSTDTSPSSLNFYDVRATTNAQYRVSYPGGTSGTGSFANTYSAVDSAPVAVAVTRSLKLSSTGLKFTGKVTPDYGKKKVKILAKYGKKFKKIAAVKTKKNGKFTFTGPRKNNLKIVFIIPGDANYAAVPSDVYKATVI